MNPKALQLSTTKDTHVDRSELLIGLSVFPATQQDRDAFLLTAPALVPGTI